MAKPYGLSGFSCSVFFALRSPPGFSPKRKARRRILAAALVAAVDILRLGTPSRLAPALWAAPTRSAARMTKPYGLSGSHSRCNDPFS